MVLLMSVNPGFGGQKFIENTIEKVERLKELIVNTSSKALIEVDGGVQAETAPRLVQAGVDVLVSGSYVFKADDPKAVISQLRSLYVGDVNYHHRNNIKSSDMFLYVTAFFVLLSDGKMINRYKSFFLSSQNLIMLCQL